MSSPDEGQGSIETCVDTQRVITQPTKKYVGEVYACELCGAEYKARAVHQKFCSESCRLEANGVKDKQALISNKRKKSRSM